MPRTARQKSMSGIYHIMMRGIDKRNIFITDDDYLKFLSYLGRAKEKVNYSLYAYCFMSNHVHLLLKTEDNLGKIMQSVSIGYAQYYNNKNNRMGHLFQNRYKSESVELDIYFLTVLRYIHQNPLKAGIVKNILDYPWSSYHDYLNAFKGKEFNPILEPKFGIDMFQNEKEFTKFMIQANDDECMEHIEKVKYSDEELSKVIDSLLPGKSYLRLDKKARTKFHRDIKIKTKASSRQLARVMGISRSNFEHLEDF